MKKFRIFGLMSIVALTAFFAACSNPSGPDGSQNVSAYTAPQWDENAIIAFFVNGVVNEVYGPVTLAATGLPVPTFEFTNRPVWMTQTGERGEIISGTPTAQGAYTFTILARNSQGVTPSVTVTIEITATQMPPAINPASLTVNGIVGQELSHGLLLSVGTGTPTWTTGDPLPSGLILGSNGVITGTPTAGGTFSINVNVSTAYGSDSGTVNFTITAPPVITTTSLPEATLNLGYMMRHDLPAGDGNNSPVQIAATGYPAPTFTATGLPPGLTINSTTGVIFGSPTTTGNYNATITATNSGGTYPRNFTITVLPRLGRVWQAIAAGTGPGQSGIIGGQPIRHVAFGNNTFLAIGYDGLFTRSTDNGVSWTGGQMSAGMRHNFYGIAYGFINNTHHRWVVAGAGGHMAYSDDAGNNWSPIAPGAAGSQFTARINDVIFGGGRFVAVGDGGNIATSADGIIWVPATTPVTTNIYGVTYGDGLFVAVGAGGRILTSPNGSTWTDSTNPLIGNINGIGFGNGRFVAGASDGRLAWSANGTTWTAIAAGPSGSTLSSDHVVRRIAFGSGTFVAVSGIPVVGHGTIAWSQDGLNWRNVPHGEANNVVGTTMPVWLFGIAYGNGTFVSVGNSGRIARSIP